MRDAIRFFFDEHIPDAAAVGLRARGIDVLTADEANRLSFPDDEQLRFATANGRVMTTYDADYLVLASDFLLRGEPFAGVAYCLPHKYQSQVGRLVHSLLALHAKLTATEMLNHVEYI